MAIPPDLPRLIYEALAGLGDVTDPDAIAKAVRRLDHGLPAEDEFSVVCVWLGRCELIHKLDQQQTPPNSRDCYQVPDLLAKFASAGPVLIEVKVCNDQTLSFKPDYYQRLTAYADIVGLPMLIAWKFHSVWMLFELRHMSLAKVNYNIRFDLAMKQNLLGVLAGDVAYRPMPGAGIHLIIAKENLIDTREDGRTTTETWQMRLRRIDFTGGGGEPAKLHAETGQLFLTLDLGAEEEHSSTEIRQSFVVTEETGMQFAHRALVGLLDWESGAKDRPSWRSLLSAPKVIRSVADFHTALTRALGEGVIQHIFRQQPADMPPFLEDTDYP